MRKTETFNGIREYPVAGHKLELVNTVNPVDVVLYDGDGNVLAREPQAQGGDYWDRRDKIPFSRFEITTGALEAVTFVVSDAEGGTKRVSADVADRPSRQLGTLNGAAHANNAKVAGAASAQALAANPLRKYLGIQNQDAVEKIFVRTDGGVAAPNSTSMRVDPGLLWEPPVPPTGQINIIRGGGVDVAVQVTEA